MILLLHVSIALASVAYTTYTYITPSQAKLRISYSLVTATLASGTYLVISTHSPLLQACLSGIGYLAAISAGLLLARNKLARA